MKKIFFTFLIVLPLVSFAEEKDPKAIVEDIFQRAGQEQIITDDALQADVSKHVDFEAMAKAVVAKSKIPAKELAWFQSTLREIITRTVYPEAPGFLKNVSITYKAVEINGDDAVVHSLVKRKADVSDVSYKLTKQNQSEWRVVDISLDGESWVGNIREQVSTTLQKKKWAGLKEALNKRLIKLRQSKKTT